MTFINNWIRKEIQEMQSYAIQPSKNMLKLDAMESPFALPENIKNELYERLKTASINHYPCNYEQLKKVIYNVMNIPKELKIILGNGSDELIQILALACDNNDTIASFEPGFVMYKIIAKITKLNYIAIDLDNNFDINIDKTLTIIKKNKIKIIFISYPNNPTANNFDKVAIKKIIKSTNALVVIDEAYYAYSNDSFINDIDNYNNLIILRTISKIGFAGLRLGVMIGNNEIITQLNKLKMPYNINILTQIAAQFLLSNKQLIANNANIIIKNRQKMLQELTNIQQITPYPSDANFILFKAKNADKLFEFLKRQQILIKNITNIIDNCLRVTVSIDADNKKILQALKKFYE